MDFKIRTAVFSDVKKIVNMLSDDKLGQTREDNSTPLNSGYIKAYEAIDKDLNNEVIVMENEGRILGMLQLTIIPYLTHMGSWRCLVEGVRVHKEFRGQGLGVELLKWSINRAKERDCKMIQLTSDKQRPETLRFYEMLGFKASHEGFKLKL